MVDLSILYCKRSKMPTSSALQHPDCWVATGYSVEGQGEAGGRWAVCGVLVQLWPLPEGFSALGHKPLSLQGSIVALDHRTLVLGPH